MKRDVSLSLPNFRPTATKQRQKKIRIERSKRICLPTDRSRGGVVMQTRTGGRLATPVQQRTRRQIVAQYGNTRMIPSQIRDPTNAEKEPTAETEKIDPAERGFFTLETILQKRLDKLIDQGKGTSPEAAQIRIQLAAVRRKKNPSVFDDKLDDLDYPSSSFFSSPSTPPSAAPPSATPPSATPPSAAPPSAPPSSPSAIPSSSSSSSSSSSAMSPLINTKFEDADDDDFVFDDIEGILKDDPLFTATGGVDDEGDWEAERYRGGENNRDEALFSIFLEDYEKEANEEMNILETWTNQENRPSYERELFGLQLEIYATILETLDEETTEADEDMIRLVYQEKLKLLKEKYPKDVGELERLSRMFTTKMNLLIRNKNNTLKVSPFSKKETKVLMTPSKMIPASPYARFEGSSSKKGKGKGKGKERE